MKTDFQLSLFRETEEPKPKPRANLVLVPKIDLHRHLLGSVTVETFVRISRRYSLPLPAQDEGTLRTMLTIDKPVKGLAELFKPWRFMSRLVVSPEAVCDLTYEALKSAAEDNIRYVELRASWGITGKEKFSVHDFLSGFAAGIRSGEKDFAIVGRLVFGITRHIMGNHEPQFRNKLYQRIAKAVADFKGDYVVGFDLSGIEDSCKPATFRDFFVEMKQEGFGISIHAGETTGPRDIWEAVNDLSADRIAHGVSAISDKTLLDHLHQNSIPLEICPTSNVLTGVVQSMKKHPIRDLWNHKIVITVNTDNPGLCRISLSGEFESLINELDFSISDLRKFVQNAIEVSFAPQALKRKIRKEIDQEELKFDQKGGC